MSGATMTKHIFSTLALLCLVAAILLKVTDGDWEWYAFLTLLSSQIASGDGR